MSIQLQYRGSFIRNYTVKNITRFLDYFWPNLPGTGICTFFPARESLVSDIPAGDGKSLNLYLQCNCFFAHVKEKSIFGYHVMYAKKYLIGEWNSGTLLLPSADRNDAFCIFLNIKICSVELANLRNFFVRNNWELPTVNASLLCQEGWRKNLTLINRRIFRSFEKLSFLSKFSITLFCCTVYFWLHCCAKEMILPTRQIYFYFEKCYW